MHMADALISPTVGAALWTASASLLALSARKVRAALDDRRVPLMGVLGAFVFAAQMINFSIPGTGSSGHLGGGLLLAILLGPDAAFLTIASVLTVQALFFADGGLLALGCNIINLGFFPCFLAYPFIYRRLAGPGASRGRLTLAAVLAAAVGLQLGALGVVFETAGSGLSDLPWRAFILLMLPIHLAIGLVEGVVTAAVAGFIRQARPEVIALAEARPVGRFPLGGVLAGVALAALLTAGVLAWFASTRPDGLEWSLARAASKTERPHTPVKVEPVGLASPAHSVLERVQRQIALFPDYALPRSPVPVAITEPAAASPVTSTAPEPLSVTSARVGTSLAGVAGSALTLVLVALCGLLLRWRRTSTAQ
jgi:cobalt/nickel transport system permease protein